MRSKVPTFGRACFVDSTPLPNNIGSPFNALCSHGVSATSVQMRLVLVLDELTCLPIWYEIIPGNVLDINTLKTVTKDVEVHLIRHIINNVNIFNFVKDETKSMRWRYLTAKVNK